MENHGTITAIAIPEDTKLGYALAYEGDGIYTNRPEQKRGVVQKQMIQTIKANSNDLGVVVYDDYHSNS
jgi:DNA (cytosine-5)-methyltransferase 1